MWSQFLIREGYSAHSLERGLGERLLRDIRKGIESGRFRGEDPLMSFLSVATYRGGLFVTLGDVTGDQVLDIVTGAGPLSGGWVRVYDGSSNASGVPLNSFQACAGGSFNVQAPVRVLARDMDGDGKSELWATQGPDGRSKYQVRRFNALTAQLVDSFFAASPDVSGGGLYLG